MNITDPHAYEHAVEAHTQVCKDIPYAHHLTMVEHVGCHSMWLNPNKGFMAYDPEIIPNLCQHELMDIILDGLQTFLGVSKLPCVFAPLYSTYEH